MVPYSIGFFVTFVIRFFVINSLKNQEERENDEVQHVPTDYDDFSDVDLTMGIDIQNSDDEDQSDELNLKN